MCATGPCWWKRTRRSGGQERREEETPEGLTVERVRLMLRWLSRAYATQVDGVAFASRMTEGQAEARWEALPARFGWVVKAAEDRAAEGEVERGIVEEEAQGTGQTVGEDGAVGGVREVGMSAVAEVKDRLGWKFWSHGWVWMRRRV